MPKTKPVSPKAGDAKRPSRGGKEKYNFLDYKIIEQARAMLEEAEQKLQAVKKILFQGAYLQRAQITKVKEGSRVIEGVFDGENLLTASAKKYPVPPNYASKSKLVCGDLLKLTIAADGTFIFKQIGPVPRAKVIGILEKEDDNFYAQLDNRRYKILTATLTYFKARPGDKLTLIVPKDGQAGWAAVENVLPK